LKYNTEADPREFKGFHGTGFGAGFGAGAGFKYNMIWSSEIKMLNYLDTESLHSFIFFNFCCKVLDVLLVSSHIYANA